MLYSIVGLLVIILDQAVKFWVSNTLFGTDVVRFIPGVLSLVNVHNDGAAFSFLSGQGARVYFIIATGVFVILVIIALATNFIRGKFSRWCLVLVAAGGLANMIDRIIYGYVQDMFKVELFNFAIFNVADVFITVFSILFALSMIFEKPETDQIDVLYEDDEDERPKKLSRKEKKELKLAEQRAALEAASVVPTPAAAPASSEEPVPAPAASKRSSVRSARKSRQEKYEQEYEEYKAQQRAAMRKDEPAPEPEKPAPRAEESAPAPAEKPNPFAAWENANAKAEAEKADSYAGRLMETGSSSARTERRSARAVAATQSAAPAEKPAPKPAPVPAPAPAQPAPKPEVEEEFSLDDILAEFK